MSKSSPRRRIEKLPTIKVSLSLDIVANAAVEARAAKDGVSFSRAASALIISAAVMDDGLMEVIQQTLQAEAIRRVAAKGWHPGLAEKLALEVVNGE